MKNKDYATFGVVAEKVYCGRYASDVLTDPFPCP